MQTFFQRAITTASVSGGSQGSHGPATKKTSVADAWLQKPLRSEIPLVQTFYDQLSENERLAHVIAVEKLGTSYDVTRTHGYQKWLKNRPST